MTSTRFVWYQISRYACSACGVSLPKQSTSGNSAVALAFSFRLDVWWCMSTCLDMAGNNWACRVSSLFRAVITACGHKSMVASVRVWVVYESVRCLYILYSTHSVDVSMLVR